MKCRVTLLLVSVIALSVVSAGVAMAAEKLKFAHVYEASEPYHKRMVEAAAKIKERTGGSLRY